MKNVNTRHGCRKNVGNLKYQWRWSSRDLNREYLISGLKWTASHSGTEEDLLKPAVLDTPISSMPL
jgi:hypothetical protein